MPLRPPPEERRDFVGALSLPDVASLGVSVMVSLTQIPLWSGEMDAPVDASRGSVGKDVHTDRAGTATNDGVQ